MGRNADSRNTVQTKSHRHVNLACRYSVIERHESPEIPGARGGSKFRPVTNIPERAISFKGRFGPKKAGRSHGLTVIARRWPSALSNLNFEFVEETAGKTPVTDE